MLFGLLACVCSPAAQLEYVSCQRPSLWPGSSVAWEERVSAVCWAASYMHHLSSHYKPRAAFGGPSVLIHAAPGRRSTRDVAAGWCVGYLANLAPYVQPCSLERWSEGDHALQAHGSAPTAAATASAQPARYAQQVSAVLAECVSRTRMVRQVAQALAAVSATSGGVGAAAAVPAQLLEAAALQLGRGRQVGRADLSPESASSYVVVMSPRQSEECQVRTWYLQQGDL